MKNYLKKYLLGCTLLFVLTIFSGSFNYFLSNYQINLRASVFDPDSLSADTYKTVGGFAWSDSVGWINFGSSTQRTAGQVYVSSSDLRGYAWGENIGWISFNCLNESSCNDVEYSVSNNGTGVLSGYAWGENIGWIHFNPDGGGVTINRTTGVFSGYAWGENIGWISFDDSGEDVVTTSWTNPPGGGGTTYCTDFTYTEWTACVNNLQTREVIDNLPNGCTVGATQPETSQACTPPPPPITITLDPTSISLHVKNSTTFTATVTGTSTPVSWSIKEGVVGGSIISLANNTAQYTASTTTGTYSILAKVGDKTSTSTVTVTPEDIVLPIDISIDPKIITVLTSQSVLFKSFITNTDNKNTTWIVMEEGGGTIDDNGLYTAPDYVGTFHVKAVALADIQKSDIATITVRLRKDVATSSDPENEIKDGAIKDGIINDKGNDGDDSENGKHSNSDSDRQNKDAGLLTKNIDVLGTTTEIIILKAQKILESKPGDIVTKTFTTAGVVGGGLAASTAIILNPAIVLDLFFLPLRLWGLFLSVLGLKKRHRPWGTVYDSVTKQPIDPAYVTLKKVGSNEENISITDLDGRYGFLVPPGKYILSANKTNYIFPSRKLAGKLSDELYNDLYFGQEIDLVAGAVIHKNIPLDPVNFDWNEFVKGKNKLMKFYSRKEKIIRLITDWIFRIGFLISTISLFLITAPYNIIIFILYLVLSTLRKFGLRQKAFGSLKEKSGNPLSYAIIRIISSDLNIEITNRVADKIGRYYCLVPKGKYYVKVEKKNDDESYSLVYTSPVFEAKNGIINQNFIS